MLSKVCLVLSLVFTGTNAGAQLAMRVATAPDISRSRAGVPRFPDVSATQITFLFAGELWLVPREGGAATALTHEANPKGSPKFSPDGQTIAFTGSYDGIYTIPAAGGSVVRVTHHTGATDLCDWAPGGRLLFMTDAFLFVGNFDGQSRLRQLFTVPATGGLPSKLPVPYGANGAISPDGQWLAYTFQAEGQREHIKHYQGGLAPDIWLFNLRTHQSRKITVWPGTDTAPMWHDETIYYLSDAGNERRLNIWSYEMKSGRRQQITHFENYDVKWPSIGPGPNAQGEIVFVNGTDLYLLDLGTNSSHRVDISLPENDLDIRPRAVDVSQSVTNWSLSPDGKQVVVEARGDIWIASAENAGPRDITHTSGAAERNPSWSPDGRWIAYFSDVDGEYQLYVVSSDGTGSPRQLSHLGVGFRYRPVWSPDSRRIAFADSTGSIYINTIDNAATKKIRQDPIVRQPQLSWSPDSTWLAFPGSANGVASLWLYSVDKGEAHQVTGGGYNDRSPTFDRDGDYLFFVSDRNFDPLTYDSVDYSKFIYPSTEQVMALPLRRDLGPPWQLKGNSSNRQTESPKSPLAIDFDDFERRAVIVSSDKGKYSNLAVAHDGRLLFTFAPAEGFCRSCSPIPSIKMFDFKERRESGKTEPKTVLSGAGDFRLSVSGKTLFVRQGDSIATLDVAADQKPNKSISLSNMKVEINPPSEWPQIFTEAWRIYRDFFYDPAMRGVDWPAMREKYGKLLSGCANREDVDYVIGEMLGELGSSHVYLYSPPGGQQTPEGVGILGVDFALDRGAYRFEKIYDSAPSDTEARNPLRQPGVDVREGDYLLAVNGKPLDTKQDPWAAFTGLAEKDVTLTVSSKPILDQEARLVAVRPGSFDIYRHRSWLESNRAYVERKTAGRVGYLFLHVTSEYGFREFTRQFGPQLNKEALIIDSRWDFGGHIPYHLLDILSRQVYFYGVDLRRSVSNHGYVLQGPKYILVNGVTMSGGDFLSFLTHKSGVAKLVGTRTMGAAVGAGGVFIPFIDGGFSLPPTVGLYDEHGTWVVEGRGVEPDLEVVDDPALMLKGEDPQLDAAIQLVMNDLRARPPLTPVKPPFASEIVPSETKPDMKHPVKPFTKSRH
jgi:tricorn protease